MHKEGVENFVQWTKLKVRIHLSDVKFFPRERQIWWVSIGQNIGVETNGKNENFERPVLVLKRYNKEACLVVPLSTKLKNGDYYFNFVNEEGRPNMVNLSQTRALSVKRFIRKMGKIDESKFTQVLEQFKRIV